MFVVELWESIFTPGTTPALITATHASFILLILSLSSLIYMTKSIHYINLLVISIILYGLVIWFIGELQQAKLQSNEELQVQDNQQNDAQAKGNDHDVSTDKVIDNEKSSSSETNFGLKDRKKTRKV